MAGSTSNLDLLSFGQAGKEITVNAALDAASPSTIFGRRASTTSALTWGFYGGAFIKGDGTPVQLANDTLALDASSTNYVEVDTAGVVTSNTTAFTAGKLPLYTVITGTTTVTSYTDHRNGTQGNFELAVLPDNLPEFLPPVIASTTATTSTASISFAGTDLARLTLQASVTTLTISGAVDGQRCRLEVIQDATGSRTITFPVNVVFGADLTSITLSTAANKVDELMFTYHAGTSKYRLVGVQHGF